jgi:hypothetical protein
MGFDGPLQQAVFLFLEFHLQRRTFNPHVEIFICTGDFPGWLWMYVLPASEDLDYRSD